MGHENLKECFVHMADGNGGGCSFCSVDVLCRFAIANPHPACACATVVMACKELSHVARPLLPCTCTVVMETPTAP